MAVETAGVVHKLRLIDVPVALGSVRDTDRRSFAAGILHDAVVGVVCAACTGVRVAGGIAERDMFRTVRAKVDAGAFVKG